MTMPELLLLTTIKDVEARIKALLLLLITIKDVLTIKDLEKEITLVVLLKALPVWLLLL